MTERASRLLETNEDARYHYEYSPPRLGGRRAVFSFFLFLAHVIHPSIRLVNPSPRDLIRARSRGRRSSSVGSSDEKEQKRSEMPTSSREMPFGPDASRTNPETTGRAPRDRRRLSAALFRCRNTSAIAAGRSRRSGGDVDLARARVAGGPRRRPVPPALRARGSLRQRHGSARPAPRRARSRDPLGAGSDGEGGGRLPGPRWPGGRGGDAASLIWRRRWLLRGLVPARPCERATGTHRWNPAHGPDAHRAQDVLRERAHVPVVASHRRAHRHHRRGARERASRRQSNERWRSRRRREGSPIAPGGFPSDGSSRFRRRAPRSSSCTVTSTR